MKRALILLAAILALPAATTAPVYKTCWNDTVILWSKACPKPPKGVPATKSPTPAPAPTPTPTPVPVIWTRCAVENESCSIVGTALVRYGVDGTWVTKTVTASIACNNATFGDPIVGRVKSCETTGKVAVPAPVPSPIPTPTPTPSPTPTQWITAKLGTSPFARATKTCSSIYRTREADALFINYEGVVAGSIYKLPLGEAPMNPVGYQAGWSHQVAVNIDGQTGHSWTVLSSHDIPGWYATVARECLEGVKAA